MSAARPETGATDADIEAAVQRHPLYHVLHGGADYDTEMRMRVNDWAPLLVPPGSVIALAEHVVTDELREAIGFAAAVVRYVIEGSKDGDEFCTESLQEALHYYPHDEGYQVHLARLERLGSGGEETT